VSVQQLNIGEWLRDLRKTWTAGENGPGAVALLSLINLQIGQAYELVGGLGDSTYVQRGIVRWRDDYVAINTRLAYMIAKLKEILDEPEATTRELAIYNFIARPILDGEYPQEYLTEVAAANIKGLRGIRNKPGGGGKGFGDAFAAGTLWNQAAQASDTDIHPAPGWATNLYAAWLTEVAHQLETSAPGEDPTARDRTVTVLKEIAASPGALIRALGIDPTYVVGGVVAAVVLLALVLRR
jgi:hypothetical protein